MNAREFKKLIKEKNPNYILAQYMTCKINLTEKQLQKICELGEHHGGCGFKYKKKPIL